MTKAAMERLYGVKIYNAGVKDPLKPIEGAGSVWIAYRSGDNANHAIEVCRAGSLRELGEMLEGRYKGMVVLNGTD